MSTGAQHTSRIRTARSAGLVGCQACARAWPIGTPECRACGSRLQSRDTKSLQKVWAWWLAGLICYIPANMYPMLRTRTLFMVREDTILGGALDLAEHGALGIALVIIAASVVIPITKFAAIAYLAVSVSRPAASSMTSRHHLYEVVEYIGRWSMIDVFVVAILSALVHLGSVAEIRPGPASLTFALSVIFTMISAQSFDSRLIWDEDPVTDNSPQPDPHRMKETGRRAS